MKTHMDDYDRMQERAIRQIYGWMKFKTLLFAAPLLVLALILALMWLTDEPPEAWQTERVQFASVVRYHRRHGADYYRFKTMNGREFALTDEAAKAVDEQLTPGALCEVTHRQRLGVQSICGLTSGDQVFVDRADYEEDWAKAHGELLKATSILTVLAVISAGLSYGLWCRKDRREIEEIRRQMARRVAMNEARAAKKKTRRAP